MVVVDKDEKEKIIFDLISRRLDQQMESVDSFATRAGLVLATCGVVFTGYIQLLNIRHWTSGFFGSFFILEIVLVAVAGLLAFEALIIGGEKNNWLHDPNPRKLLNNKDEPEILSEIQRSMVDAYDHNAILIEKKFSLLNISRILIIISITIFITHLIIFI